jgi:hypothetical protein
MEDPVRPNENAFTGVYERGYRTWAALWQTAVDDSRLPVQPIFKTSLYSAFPNHPHFLEGLLLGKSYSNVVTVSGKTTWTTTSTPGCCDLAPFREEMVLQVAWRQSTEIALRRDQTLFSLQDSHHFPILFYAWAYILSATWAELIPGAQAPTYNKASQPLSLAAADDDVERPEHVVVEIGNVDEDAARWWEAVLSGVSDSSWAASIRNDKGAILCSPWSIRRTKSEMVFIVSPKHTSPSSTPFHPASFKTAMWYLSEYCRLHAVSEQSEAALAAALLIPVAKFDGTRIYLPCPKPRYDNPAPIPQTGRTLPSWGEDPQQLDRLLTLSCNPRGVKTLLSSIFFQPDIDCNICGAWLQGSFAFLDSEEAKDPQLRLRTFMRRDPSLEFLWLGAFATGADARCIQDARAGWWKVDLSAAAWTGTHVSFIQGYVPKPLPAAVTDISRADECRLLYLAHGPNHATPPIFPFAPFGSTAMGDTDLDVRQHTQCAALHGLGYGGFAWDCEVGRKVDPGGRKTPSRL